MTKPCRIRVVEKKLGNVAYIHGEPGNWRCTLSNGTPAAFSYAVGTCDEMLLQFGLDDCENNEDRLALVTEFAGNRRTCELV